MTDVFVHKDGKENGPYTLEELKSRIQTGACQSTDMAWYEGLPEWKPIAELLPALETTIPPSSPPQARRSRALLFAACAVLVLTGGYAFVTETGPRNTHARAQEVAQDEGDEESDKPEVAVEDQTRPSSHKSPLAPVVASKAPQEPLPSEAQSRRSEPMAQAPSRPASTTVQPKPEPVPEEATPAQEPVAEPPATPKGPSDEMVQLGIKQYNSGWASSEFRRGEPLMSRNGTSLMPAGTLVYPVKISESGVALTFYLFQDSFGDWMCAFNDLKSALPCKE